MHVMKKTNWNKEFSGGGISEEVAQEQRPA